jgi:hypothetical protein
MNNQQWQQIEGYAATDLNDDYAICLLELRDRVVALEGQQREAAMNELRAASTEAQPTTDEPTDRGLRELFWSRPAGPETEAVALRRVYRAGMAAAAVQSSAQQEIADAEAFGLASTSSPLVERVANSQSTPNDRQIRSSADHFGQVNKIVPASSLVKIVECAIEDCSEKDYNSYQPEARATIRAVAAWLRTRLLHAAELLEQEANR